MHVSWGKKAIEQSRIAEYPSTQNTQNVMRKWDTEIEIENRNETQLPAWKPISLLPSDGLDQAQDHVF